MRNARCRVVGTLVVSASLATFATAGGTLVVEHTTTHPGQFGWNVSTVGDVDGDGRSDYAVGARGSSYVTVYSGFSRTLLYEINDSLFFGAAIAPYADVTGEGLADFLVGAPSSPGPGAPPGFVSVRAGGNGAEIRRVTGASAAERFGTSVASIGDVNDDGKPDFVVGAPGGSGISAGVVRVYSGADGAEITALSKTGSTFRDNLGRSVVGLGDVNHDGVPDFAAGAPGADPANLGTGITYGRVIIVSGKDGATLRTINGKAKLGVFGEAMSTCGDQDKDGVTDLLVGARGANGLVGQAYVYSGRTGRKLLTLTGITPRGFFGIGVAGLDDYDGDGRPEIAVGAELDGSGEVVVVSPGKRKLYFLHRAAPGDLVGDFLSRAGDLDGDGKTELLVGAWGHDKARVFKIDTTPLPLPERFTKVVKLALPAAATGRTRGSIRLQTRGAVLSATISATSLPTGRTYVAYLEDGVGTGSFFSIGTLTLTKTGAGTLVLSAQYIPPPQLQTATFADLSGRKVELRDGATVVLGATIP